LLLCSFALPASASPPQDLSFIFDVTYSPIPTDKGFGSWSSAGLFTGSGDVHETYVVGGWDNCWTTIHTTSVLTGPTPEDTITVRMQVVRIEEGPSLPSPLPPLCSAITAKGNWTILSATGIYAGLNGQGQATISTLFVPNHFRTLLADIEALPAIVTRLGRAADAEMRFRRPSSSI
jgi:hypothetical protein